MRASTTTHAPLHPSVYMYVHVRDQNDNATYASTRWVPTVRHFLACEDVAGGSQQSGGQIIFFAQTHFLACEGVAGGSQQSGGESFFLPGRTSLRAKMKLVGPSSQGDTFFLRNTVAVRWVPAVRRRNHYFSHNKEALPCCGRGPSCQRLHTQYSSDGSRSLTIDHAAPRAPRRWTTARPRKGTKRSQGRHGSGSPRGEEYEGSLVRLRCEAAVAAGLGQLWE